MVQLATRLQKACVAHNKLAEELDTFATATRGRGLCEFWTCDRKSYILDLPTSKGDQVLGIITSQFQGRFEGFSGDSGARCSSAGAPLAHCSSAGVSVAHCSSAGVSLASSSSSSTATATHCYSALAALDTALQALATRAWASIVHQIHEQMRDHPSWEDPPLRLCQMVDWYETAHGVWKTAKQERSLKVHHPGYDIRNKSVRNAQLLTDPYPNPKVQWQPHTNRVGCLGEMGSHRAELRPTGSCGVAPMVPIWCKGGPWGVAWGAAVALGKHGPWDAMGVALCLVEPHWVLWRGPNGSMCGPCVTDGGSM
jgi:hypothetical protein